MVHLRVKCHLKCHTHSDIFKSATFSFRVQKFPRPHVAYSLNGIRLSTRSVQSMQHKARVSGGKFALLLLLCHGRRLVTNLLLIGFENIGIHPFTRYRIPCLFFFHPGERI